ncbi:MAG: DUF1349 domain-containing protein [Acidobacteriota bacterium]
MKNLAQNFMLLIVSVVVMAACGSPPPAVNKATPTPTPAPVPPGAVKVEKPVNVSFSTYSKDWPVAWQWIDPDEKHAPTPHDVKKEVLRVRVPTKKDLSSHLKNAPRYLKAITGDFEIETGVKIFPKENFQGAGLLIYSDDNNYLRFLRAYGGPGGGGEGILLDTRKGTEFAPIATTASIATESESVDLKVVRMGKVFTAYWRENENAEWRLAGDYESEYPETIQIGLVACNTAREVVAEFGYIRLLPAAKSSATEH